MQLIPDKLKKKKKRLQTTNHINFNCVWKDVVSSCLRKWYEGWSRAAVPLISSLSVWYSVYWLDYVMGHEVHCVCSACTTQPIRDSANQGSVLTPDLNIPITALRNCWDGHLCSGPVKVIDLRLFNYKWVREKQICGNCPLSLLWQWHTMMYLRLCVWESNVLFKG